jgi:hypothetical protein
LRPIRTGNTCPEGRAEAEVEDDASPLGDLSALEGGERDEPRRRYGLKRGSLASSWNEHATLRVLHGPHLISCVKPPHRCFLQGGCEPNSSHDGQVMR